MTKTTWGPSAWACAFVVGLATNALFASGAYGQAGWGASSEQSAAAAKKSPPPPPLQIAGTWNGTIQDNIKGPGTINLTFTEEVGKTKATLKGTWMISFPETAPFGVVNDFGAVTGSVVGSAGNAVKFTLVPKKGDDIGTCRNVVHSVEATQEMISATYSACGHNGTINIQPGVPSNTVFINMGDNFFFPKTLTISRGQTVRWTNNGNKEHSINANPGTHGCKPTSGEAFDSPAIEPGTTYERTFNNAGTFAYHCEFQGCPMNGTITVN